MLTKQSATASKGTKSVSQPIHELRKLLEYDAEPTKLLVPLVPYLRVPLQLLMEILSHQLNRVMRAG
jgi:hypothetical protein